MCWTRALGANHGRKRDGFQAARRRRTERILSHRIARPAGRLTPACAANTISPCVDSNLWRSQFSFYPFPRFGAQQAGEHEAQADEFESGLS